MTHTTTAETTTARLKVAIIVGSTRPGRKADTIARWVYDIAAKRDDAVFEVVDIADYALPHFDEPMPPMAGRYTQPHTLEWASVIAGYDAFVFVTPEYNRSTTGVLKNAIDFLFAEWNDKAAGFVSYGAHEGLRAVEQLRQIMGELKIADVRMSVGLSMVEDFEDWTRFAPREDRRKYISIMLDEVTAWGGALKALRAGTAA